MSPTLRRIVLVDGPFEWPAGLLALLAREGYAAVHVGEMDSVPPLLLRGDISAVLVGGPPLGAKELLTLRECRELFPGVAVIALATPSATPELKRAFDMGATAFLSWPAPAEAVRRALASAVRVRGGARGRQAARTRPRDQDDAPRVHVEGPCPPGSPAHVMASAIHDVLAGLEGPWDVSVRPLPGSCTVTVVGPDASLWSMVLGDADPLAVAERVRSACSIRSRLGGRPVRAARRQREARRCR